MQHKWLILGFLCLLLAAVIFISFTNLRNSVYQAYLQGEGLVVRHRDYSFATKKIEEKNAALNYSVVAEYPEWRGGSAAAREVFNTTISRVVEERVKEFTDEIAELAPKFTQGSTLVIRYKIPTETKTLASVLFTAEYYTAGAAHPGREFATFNFTVAEERFIRLSDVFKPGTAYLQKLSELATADLLEQVEEGAFASSEEFISQGASPDERNFEDFILDQINLTIYFEEYQVGPYAAGSTKVVIPLEKLGDILTEKQ